MSNEVFPVLPGQTWPRVKVPTFYNDEQISAQGRRWVTTQAQYPTYTIRIPYEFLRPADLSALVGLFKRMRGNGDTFLFDDRDDNTVSTPQGFAIGDNTTTTFQLVRAKDGFTEPVSKVNGPIVVRGNGTTILSSNYTVDDYGRITFNSIPPSGQVLDWTGQYYWRCHFTRELWEIEEFMRNLHKTRSVEFKTHKA